MLALMGSSPGMTEKGGWYCLRGGPGRLKQEKINLEL
jgi:hypothetical protein